MSAKPEERLHKALAQSDRRLALKVTKRYAMLDMRDLDASWPDYLRAQNIVAEQEFYVSTREALLYWLDVLASAGHIAPADPLPRPWNRKQFADLLRLTGPIHIKKLIENGWDEQAALLSGLRRTLHWVLGYNHKQANQQVIDASVTANTQSRTLYNTEIMQGYERVPEPGACAFCRMIAGASRKHPVFNRSPQWDEPHPGCKCDIKALPVYKTVRVLTAREIALNRVMYESIKASRDRALAAAKAA